MRINAIQKINRKDNRVVKANKHSMQKRVELRKWPLTGMPELVALVDKDIIWAKQLISCLNDGDSDMGLSIADCRRYTDVIVSSLYTKTPQGRGMAWEDIKCLQLDGMLVCFLILTLH